MSKKKAPKTNALAETAALLAAFQTRLDGADKNATYALELLRAQAGINEKTTTSLYALRDSTAKAFRNVTEDMGNVLTALQRLNERVSRVESQITHAAGLAQLNHLSERLHAVEGTTIPVFYMGYDALFRGHMVRLEKDRKVEDTFILPSAIGSIEPTSWGLNITLKTGDQYLLSGGPTTATMFLNFLRSGLGDASNANSALSEGEN